MKICKGKYMMIIIMIIDSIRRSLTFFKTFIALISLCVWLKQLLFKPIILAGMVFSIVEGSNCNCAKSDSSCNHMNALLGKCIIDHADRA